MLELFFLLVIIPRRVRVLAGERGESAVKWSLLAIGAWIGTEIIVGFIFGIIGGTLIAFLGYREIPPVMTILFYIVALGGAALAATLVIQQLRKKAVVETPPFITSH